MITFANIWYDKEIQRWKTLLVHDGQKYGSLHDTEDDAERSMGASVVHLLCCPKV